MAIVDSAPHPAAVSEPQPQPATVPGDGYAGAVALITGGASGIGHALARELGRRGTTVVVVDLNREGVERVAEELREHGGSAEAAAIDVTDAGAIERLIDHTLERYGRIDFLFNNAGVGWGGNFQEMSTAEIERMVAINLRAVVLASSVVYPIMIRQGSGHIINTASVDGLIPKPRLALYSATKHAVVGFSHALNAESQAHGVSVSVVCPGLVDTSIRETSAAILRESSDGGQKPPASRMMTADRCAEVILRGLERREGTIVVAFFQPIWWLYRTVPGLFRRLAVPLYLAKMGHTPRSRVGRLYARTVRWTVRFLRTGRIR